jgi:hypothetical protein
VNEYTVRPAFLAWRPITVRAQSFVEAIDEAKKMFGFVGARETLLISRVIPLS